ncbi:MAG: hypothetical protein ABSE05_10250 [Syntrophales bacterium]
MNNSTNAETIQTFRLPISMVGIGANVGVLANILEAWGTSEIMFKRLYLIYLSPLFLLWIYTADIE